MHRLISQLLFLVDDLNEAKCNVLIVVSFLGYVFKSDFIFVRPIKAAKKYAE